MKVMKEETINSNITTSEYYMLRLTAAGASTAAAGTEAPLASASAASECFSWLDAATDLTTHTDVVKHLWMLLPGTNTVVFHTEEALHFLHSDYLSPFVITTNVIFISAASSCVILNVFV